MYSTQVKLVALKRAVFFCRSPIEKRLTSETVEGTSLTLQSVDDIHGGDGLPLGVLGVGDSVTDDVLKEHLEDTSGLLVDQTGDTLHTTTTGQAPNRWLCNTLDIIAQDLAVALCTAFAKSLSTLS